MEPLTEPPSQTLTSIAWSQLNHDTLKHYGDEWRMRLGQGDINAPIHRFAFNPPLILKGYFGIAPQDYSMWTICTSSEGKLYIVHNETGNRRHEDGSYNDSLEVPRLTMYQLMKPATPPPADMTTPPTTLFPKGGCPYADGYYKYTCPDCNRKFNTFSCPWCPHDAD